MNAQTVITISREFGSGGHEIGEIVAKQLGVPFFDKKLIEIASKTSGIHPSHFQAAEENPPTSFLYSLSIAASSANPFSGYSDFMLSDQIFRAQADAVRKAAEEGSCVIVGRCADSILQERPNCLHVFIHAGMDARIRRIQRLYQLEERNAREMIQKIDKKRRSYYQFYADARWGDAGHYHLCLDSGKLGAGVCAKLIEQAAEACGGRT